MQEIGYGFVFSVLAVAASASYCPSGQYSDYDNNCMNCYNGPTNSIYNGPGDISGTCPWSCATGFYQRYGSCYRDYDASSCVVGQYFAYGSCQFCTGLPSYAVYVTTGGTFASGCSWKCNAGYLQVGTTNCVSKCSTGYYYSAMSMGCLSCSNGPANSYYLTDGGINAYGCSWSAKLATTNMEMCANTPLIRAVRVRPLRPQHPLQLQAADQLTCLQQPLTLQWLPVLGASVGSCC